MEILIPALICFAIAVVCAVILTVASHFFAVKKDEKALAIRECLPGANCGACGFSGCDGYAKALSEGKASETNLCVPGGDKCSREIAEILGVEAGAVIEQVAYVSCNGRCDMPKKYDYQGPKNCWAANMGYQGDRFCTFACLGYGDCVAACPQDAIVIDNGVARVKPIKCIGCGICVRTCPNGIIRLVDDTVKVVVESKKIRN